MVYLNDLLLFLSVGSIDEPTSCPTCQALASMELIHNRCLFSDKQCIRVQETPDEIPEGETPTTISLVTLTLAHITYEVSNFYALRFCYFCP